MKTNIYRLCNLLDFERYAARCGWVELGGEYYGGQPEVDRMITMATHLKYRKVPPVEIVPSDTLEAEDVAAALVARGTFAPDPYVAKIVGQ